MRFAPPTTLLLPALSLALALTCGELVARRVAHGSGSLAPAEERREVMRVLERGFHVYDMFRTDEQGVFKANPGFDFSRFPKFQDIRINPSGFRGRDFLPADDSGTSLLLIGDSFTWGSEATPVPGNCFADLLEREGYHVWNAGVPGADPGHYARIAEHYVPVLRPDVVATFVFLGNDVGRPPAPIAPHRNPHYVTSLGWIRGYDDFGRFFGDAEEAANHYLVSRYGLHLDRIWRVLFRSELVRRMAVLRWESAGRATGTRLRVEGDGWVREALLRIRRVSREHGARPFLFLIPADGAADVRRQLGTFQGLDPLYPAPGLLDVSDYTRSQDPHFNNRGHAKYAHFVLRHLPPTPLEPEPPGDVAFRPTPDRRGGKP